MAGLVADKAAAKPSGAGRLSSWIAFAARRPSLASLLSGAVTALALPPFSILPGLLGFALWLFLLARAEHRRATFLLGWWFGLGHFVVGLYWIAIAFFTDAGKFGALALPAVLLLSAVMAVFPAIAALAFGLARPHHPVAQALALAIAWVSGEWLREQFLWGFPWNLIGYVWTAVLPISQMAAYVGVYGLGLVAVLAGALCLTLLVEDDRAGWSGPGLSALMIGLLLAGGGLRLAGGEVGETEGVRLRLVQANIAQHHKWDPELRAASFRRHLDLSATPPEQGAAPPTHIIWPETASAYVLDQDQVARGAIAEVTPPGGHLLTGFNRFDLESEPKRAWNSLAAVNNQGEITALYDKHRLVPFGEFLPWRALLSRIGLKKITAGSIDFQPGEGMTALEIDGLPAFSPLICYEAIFTSGVTPEDVAPRDRRPAWLLNVTNDAWFGQSSGPYQHLAMARMRAIEEGLPLVRSANTGISAVIDPFGRTLARLDLGETGVLDTALPKPLKQPPLYARQPATLILLSVVIAVALIFMIEKLLKNRYVKFR
ncbi:MAG: apolipoprotein N-acyltransferase [Alphaproteobacteria bacterium]|nr:apolipoprotein N-acyltransferase [Alphaproteobacteria bacterium]